MIYTDFQGEKISQLGMGTMRLPVVDGDNANIDEAAALEMFDYAYKHGINYFDTAWGYHDGNAELVTGKALSRYPRESFLLVDKLSTSLFNSEEEIRPLFEKQLAACGVEYFDLYLLHSQTKDIFEKYKKCHAYETAFALRDEGKVKHVGLSFHDKAEVLDEILTTYPQVEAVQIQLNYLDFDDPAVQSRKCYEVCRKHGKPVIVMEPVKGGTLVNLPADAQKILTDLHGGSPASYAIRFAAGFEGIFMVLSGMSNMEQLNDNLSYMKDFKPLDETEKEAVNRVCSVIRSMHLIPCTACRYCQAYKHSESFLMLECTAIPSRLERKPLLRSPYRKRRKGFRLHRLRKMRKSLSAASQDT